MHVKRDQQERTYIHKKRGATPAVSRGVSNITAVVSIAEVENTPAHFLWQFWHIAASTNNYSWPCSSLLVHPLQYFRPLSLFSSSNLLCSYVRSWMAPAVPTDPVPPSHMYAPQGSLSCRHYGKKHKWGSKLCLSVCLTPAGDVV